MEFIVVRFAFLKCCILLLNTLIKIQVVTPIR